MCVLTGAGAALAAVDLAIMNEVCADWPDASKKAATEMHAKYGLPDGATSMMLVWNDRSPWQKITVHGQAIPHNFPKPHMDVLEHTIAFDVPADKFDELAAFDGSVIAERTAGTLSARCDAEPNNILALNLAVDIIQDRKTVAEARTAFAENAKAAMAGQKPEYMSALRFEIPTAMSARDADEAVIQQ